MADAGPRADDLPTLREQLAQVTKERDEVRALQHDIPNDGWAANRDRLVRVCGKLLAKSEVHRIGAAPDLKCWVLSVRIALRQFRVLLESLTPPGAAEARLSALQAQIAAIEQYAQELRSSTIAKPRGAFGRFKLKVADTLSQIAGTHERGKEVR